MSRRLDLTGHKYGLLTCVRYVGEPKWLCRCECEREIVVKTNNLRSGNSKSCGCTRSEVNRRSWAENRENMRTPHARIDLTGRRFGHLVGLSLEAAATREDLRTMWRFRCDCGAEIVRDGAVVRKGKIRSCGCASNDLRSDSLVQHGHARVGQISSEYTTWMAMRTRCTNPEHDAYPYYGGRGIRVCERWTDSFASFLADMGPKPTPKHTIDRLDNNRGYEPGNCRWATWSEQVRNRRPMEART